MFKTPPINVKSKSCGKCDCVDTMDMVQCDSCDIWYHFTCVGVNQSIENHAWICFKCKSQQATGNKYKKTEKTTTVSLTSGNSQQRKTSAETVKEFPKESVKSSHHSNIDLELMRLEEEKALEQKYLQRKFEIMARSEHGSQSVYSVASQRSVRTHQWVSKLPVPTQTENANQECHYEDDIHLTRTRIAARHVLSKELPTFSGKPEEWPVFLCSYEESTKICGFSESENLLRLQKALKGKAYESVSSLLLIPKNVPQVIQTLTMMFGRPEIIINSLIEKIRMEPPIKSEKLDTLISYAISVRNLCSSLEASGMTNHIKNPLLTQELIGKLPAQLKLNWSLHIGESESDITQFSNWLFSLAEAATRISNTCSTGKGFTNVHKGEQEIASGDKLKCCACFENHQLEECEKFKTMKLNQRWDLVKNKKLCRICLKKHGNFRCSDKRCSVQGCEYRHHNLLHKFVQNATVSAHSANFKSENKTYFKILPVVLYNDDRYIEIFAMLDDGSNVTLIDQDVCDFLELQGKTDTLCLKWTSGTTRNEENSMKVNMMISGYGPNVKKYDLSNVQTVKQLALPTQTLEDKEVKYYKHLNNLPIKSYVNAIPKVLIGLNNGHLSNTLKMIEGNINEPCASKTRLGWVIHGGGVSSENNQNVFHINSCECTHEFEKIHQLMSEYISLESAGVTYDLKSAEEERANLILQSTTKRIGKRFETGLLWKDDELKIPDSYQMALKRLKCLEHRLNSDEKAIVNNQIENLVDKGYARKLSTDEASQPQNRIWYLPIFTVTNPNKPNKIRLVWDAAAKVNGTSLNSMLLKGPDLMTPLLSVLHGFRMGRIAISADIKEMFHQVRIRKEDQHAQRFLWKNNDSDNPDIYIMEVMTFGAACSPSSAQYVKNKNALEFVESHPRAVNSITQHHYVDDLLDCADSTEEVIQLARDVANIHKEGGFFIRNFKSNSPEVLSNLKDLEESNCLNENNNIELSTEKVLGMWWLTETDEFTFLLKLNRVDKTLLSGTKKVTKLDILRTLMSIFDPFGFLSPFVIYLKILLQEVWRTNEGWHNHVNDQQFQKWLIWIKLLPKIEKIKIPRWYNLTSDSKVQLHVFVDASEQAYAAVAYFRIECNGETFCKLISSKTKVAPKQPISIPRMELLAAVQGVRLAISICKMHQIFFEKRCFWSDSNTVLSWINSEARNYKQFVMFRIGEILEKTQPCEWRYISSKMNVADDATKWKGETVFDLQNRWYQGPQFLKEEEQLWPKKQTFEKSKEELRPHIVMIHAGQLNIQNQCLEVEKFSSWRKLLYTIKNVFKFYYKLKHQNISLSVVLLKSENAIYKIIQNDVYKDEICLLRASQSVHKTSDLYKCSPYLDDNSVIRVHGRIDLAEVNKDAKRPIILPRNHIGTQLIIQHYHELYHHVQHETCINEIRQKFYIPRLRSELRKVRNKCQHCKNFNALPVIPEMASLPNARLSFNQRPFSYVGIDYFGPLYVTVGRHKEKRWGVIFTCMTIRAIHIEVAKDLTTDSCIIVIQNFIARRGTPIEIYCDNGTNLRGAETELKKALQEVDFNKMEVKYSTANTTWKFNPPASPHMGGCWERLIRSIKKILYKIFPQFSFRDHTLSSALIECERVINSRPLTYVELDSSSDEALTPNHFLLGSSNGMKPLGEFVEADCMLRKNWRKLQFFSNLFWKRWVQEYLPTLTKRTKWFKNQGNLSVDDVVVIVDPNLPRNNWPMGLIVDVHTGKDGNVRSAVVKTKDGIFTRPVVKLAKLDVKPSEY